jgi:hypothetical protein
VPQRRLIPGGLENEVRRRARSLERLRHTFCARVRLGARRLRYPCDKEAIQGGLGAELFSHGAEAGEVVVFFVPFQGAVVGLAALEVEHVGDGEQARASGFGSLEFAPSRTNFDIDRINAA